ncbi:hypothetical protein QNH08_gp29 [Aeromonas phage pAh6.2TG]|uniref:Uncharacterized protein n=2 Tax=Phayathaivirus TaxID=3153015 RepID=A0A8F3C947_9CAUD|nr:hypothetical protein QNH08_gp29 [Aeromonas phage pAh6.2TG]YP_010845308.1 hypothetical protein QNH09_gp26 [Aeromonas phage PVN03]QLI47626.1 hypothetical protein [Aeromonas phage PVN02]QTQ06872.1 hypothetical protein [Aeromonas phage PVN04]QTQ06939.1 hypothetical protein [Aeromonas phage PVN05]QTQ06808.1 hypothetical protein [Aeromonas phage PVN03]QWY14061.1 hypothetical protein [Aeromonas phage pAh6.2TG]
MHVQPSESRIVAGGRMGFESDAARQGVCRGSRMAHLIHRSNNRKVVVRRRQSAAYEIVI